MTGACVCGVVIRLFGTPVLTFPVYVRLNKNIRSTWYVASLEFFVVQVSHVHEYQKTLLLILAFAHRQSVAPVVTNQARIAVPYMRGKIKQNKNEIKNLQEKIIHIIQYHAVYTKRKNRDRYS